MMPTSRQFNAHAADALRNDTLQEALRTIPDGFQTKRRKAVAALPEFEALRDQGKAIKDHVLTHLDLYLEQFEASVNAAGGHVHWARDAAEARGIVLGICQRVGARTVTKGKSMVTEEIGLGHYLEANGLESVETDLGEYIIQLRGEMPSHIIAPAFHLRKRQIVETFRRNHVDLPADRALEDDQDLLQEARGILRRKFLAADVGITGANFCVAETGATIIVTNEGNGDLTQNLPRVHVVVTGIEKMVPTTEDALVLLRLLARSATGQEFSAYTTFSAGARRPGDVDGPEEFHVVLVDNGRSALLEEPTRAVLRCIRCGACMNHCPVYGAVGGHAYGWVYPGPIGAALDPGLIGVKQGATLAGASTFCGRCEQVCPVRIPLPAIMRHWREQEWKQHLPPPAARWGLAAWAYFAKRPRLYRAATGLAARMLGLFGRGQGRYTRLPLAGGWTRHRDFPAAQGSTFQAQWAQRQKQRQNQTGAGKQGRQA
jgi:L-lactate dehydrogenase complex protein LldF